MTSPPGPAKDFHLRWSALGAPQRPAPSVVKAMRRLLAGRSGPALQLGVTPEIARLSSHGLALDWSEAMIRTVWPGDTATHKTVLGDWLAVPLKDHSMDAVFGDACLSMLDWPGDQRRLLIEAERVLRPRGRLVLRCFAGPEEREILDALKAAAIAGEISSFGAFKLRLNMAAFALPDHAPNTGARIHALFQTWFPDREALARAAGWSLADIAGIDAYAGGTSLHTYPTRRQVADLLPSSADHRFVETAGYPLAERCPLLVVDFAGA